MPANTEPSGEASVFAELRCWSGGAFKRPAQLRCPRRQGVLAQLASMGRPAVESFIKPVGYAIIQHDDAGRHKKMVTKNDLTREKIFTLLRKHQDTLMKYKVSRIALFGSYAVGKQTSKSDIDFLVEFDEPTFDNFMKLVDFLEKLFHKRVDLLTPEGVGGIRVKEVAESIKRSLLYA